MAVYTTLFLAKSIELLSGFPGLKPPLPTPTRRQFRNPFTKQLVTIETREPDWLDDDGGSVIPQYRALSLQGRHEDYLEGRLPPFVRERQHWAAKGLTAVEFEPLLKAIDVGAELVSPIYAPPSSGAVLREFPPDFISKLIGSSRSEIARRWAAEMSSPEHTHSVAGTRLNNGWTTDQAAQILTPLASLAGKATPGQAMYLLIEA
ncbi:MAG: hypothetical protein JWP03_1950 [Phycisphaerales bacterium]|nr:hypothetical protein [Phycisphaerales bacterium]